MDGGNDKKAIVYNTKEGKKKGGRRKKTKEKREKEKEKTKRVVNSQVIELEHVRGDFLYGYMRITLSF